MASASTCPTTADGKILPALVPLLLIQNITSTWPITADTNKYSIIDYLSVIFPPTPQLDNKSNMSVLHT